MLCIMYPLWVTVLPAHPWITVFIRSSLHTFLYFPPQTDSVFKQTAITYIYPHGLPKASNPA